MLPVWHAVTGILAGAICRKAYKTAYSCENSKASGQKQTSSFPGEWQCALCCSILLLLSCWQLFTALNVAWAALTGYAWNVKGGFVACTFAAGCAVSAAAAVVGLRLSAVHLVSKKETLVRCGYPLISGNARMPCLGFCSFSAFVSGTRHASDGHVRLHCVDLYLSSCICLL